MRVLKSILAVAVAGFLLAIPAYAAAPSDLSIGQDVIQSVPSSIDACSQALQPTDMLFVEATTGCDQLMAEATGLCLVPAPASIRLAAFSGSPGESLSCTPIRPSPD